MNWTAFETRTLSSDPFPHFLARDVLGELAEPMLRWLESDAPWQLKVADFYQQFEFSLADVDLPEEVALLSDRSSTDRLRQIVSSSFDCSLAPQHDVTVHKLVPGQRIRIHNDFIPGRESHRVLIQLNRGWASDSGGELLLFGAQRPPEIQKALRPVHNSCVGFEISAVSNHAVTPVAKGERFTLVYSFYRQQ